MDKKVLLMVGPTGLPDRVIQAMNQQIISHRDEQFAVLSRKLGENLKQIFQTKNDVLTLTSSGTGAMEAAVQNCFMPGDEVVVAVLGVFSERMAKICEAYNLKVVRVDAQPGTPVTPQQILESMSDKTKGVFITHNESSSGVRCDIEAFGKAISKTDALLVVDSVSALGAMDLQMDNWGVDVVFAGSQKALMGPPGLALIALSDRAWTRARETTTPTFYFDLRAAQDIHRIGQHPWTPAVSSVFSLYEATCMIMEEGLDNVYQRHIRLSNMVIDGMAELGVPLFPRSRSYASITVNTFAMDNSPAFVRRLADEHGVIISGGQDNLNATTFRVGTMGYVSECDIAAYLYAAKQILH